MKRTKQQWLELIQTQQTSDLSIVDFCREKDLPLKSFYARRSSLLKPKNIESSAFNKVTVAEKYSLQQRQSPSVSAKQPYPFQVQPMSFG